MMQIEGESEVALFIEHLEFHGSGYETPIRGGIFRYVGDQPS